MICVVLTNPGSSTPINSSSIVTYDLPHKSSTYDLPIRQGRQNTATASLRRGYTPQQVSWIGHCCIVVTKWYSATDIISLALLVLRPKFVLLQKEIFQYWLCLRNMTSFILPRYRKSRGASHYTTDTKQSVGRVPVMLELWGMQSTLSLPSLPGQLWPRSGNN